MKSVIKISALMLITICILSGCNSPVEPVPDSEMCWFIGLDGLFHHYRCDQGIEEDETGDSNYYKIITVSVNLPDTILDKYYGVFFITDTLTFAIGDERQGQCPDDNHFLVYCSSVPLNNFYIAVLVSQNQKYPVKFEPKSGDYLGWYRGDGPNLGAKSLVDNNRYCSIYLDKIP